MVTWSSVGDMTPDFIEELGQEAFDTAAEKGVVGLETYAQHKSIYLGLDPAPMEIAR